MIKNIINIIMKLFPINLGKDVENMILDMKYQLEHREKFNKCLDYIKHYVSTMDFGENCGILNVGYKVVEYTYFIEENVLEVDTCYSITNIYHNIDNSVSIEKSFDYFTINSDSDSDYEMSEEHI